MFTLKLGSWIPLPPNQALGTPSCIGEIHNIIQRNSQILYVVHVVGEHPGERGYVNQQGEVVWPN